MKKASGSFIQRLKIGKFSFSWENRLENSFRSKKCLHPDGTYAPPGAIEKIITSLGSKSKLHPRQAVFIIANNTRKEIHLDELEKT